MALTTSAPTLDVTPEKITFGRPDGNFTTISLDGILADEVYGDLGGILWACAMQLQGVMQYQDATVHLLTEILKVQAQQATILQALAAAAANAPDMPDPSKLIEDMMAKFGISDDMLAQAMRGAVPQNGVSVTKGGPGAEKTE